MRGLFGAMGCVGGKGQQINKEQKQKSKKIEKSLEEDKKKYNSTHRLLLLGKFMKYLILQVVVLILLGVKIQGNFSKCSSKKCRYGNSKVRTA